MNTPTWTTDLVVQIAQTWRNTASSDVWEEELAPLDRGRCEEAYRRLRRESRHTPTIADFLAQYRQLLGTVDPGPPGEWACTVCCDSGWVTCTEHPRHRGHWEGREHLRPKVPNDPDDCVCNIVRPCGCAAGKQAGESWRGHRSVAP
jgi:hypothetical protein